MFQLPVRKVKVEVLKMAKQLSGMRLKFVHEYLVDFNGTQAAIRAGYSPKTATMQASQILAVPAIQKIVAKVKERTLKKVFESTELTREEILRQLFYAATRCSDDFILPETGRLRPLNQLNERAKAVIDGIEQDVWTDSEGNEHVRTKLKLMSKNQAIDMAMKHKGLFAPVKGELNVRHSLSWDEAFTSKTVEEKDIIEAEIETPKSVPKIEHQTPEMPSSSPEMPSSSTSASTNGRYTIDELLDDEEEDE